MFVPNPLQIKAALIAGLVMALAIVTLTGWAFFERSRYFECRATAVRLEDQLTVLTADIKTMDGSIRATAAAGNRAAAATLKALEEAKRLNTPRPDVEASERAARAPAPAGKDCRDALAEIRAAAAAEKAQGARK